MTHRVLGTYCWFLLGKWAVHDGVATVHEDAT